MTTETATIPAIESGTWTLENQHTKIGFMAKHLMVTKVRGHFADYEGTVEIADDLTDSNIEVTIEATSITTGASDRDEHLRSGDFLDVANYPELKFVSTDISRDGDRFQITGDLTIRDVTRPITLEATYEDTVTDPWGNERIAFSARSDINREDWGLTWNAALEGGGWLVSKDVTFEIEGQLIK
ncbi:MAG TPA: YceI family protein [Acidimicrobiia bacterium]|nr:YceI family protein [Acidimicrobiia bacterium]